MEEGQRQPAGRTAELEHGVSNERAGSGLKPGGSHFRPGGGTHTVDKLGAGLHRICTEVADRAQAPADPVAGFDDDHRKAGPYELPRGGDARHAGADHQHICAVRLVHAPSLAHSSEGSDPPAPSVWRLTWRRMKPGARARTR